jgi:hypothetical protein
LCAVAVTAVLACGDDVMKMAGRVMMDAGRRMQRLDASTSDASAQSNSDASTDQSSTGAQCGTCVVSDPVTIKQPIAIKQPVKVITADTDPAQIVSGSADFTGNSNWKELEKGPLVLTDVLFTGDAGYADLATANVGKCGSARDPITPSNGGGIRGVRMMIPQGQALCGMSNSTVRWFGFRPYE